MTSMNAALVIMIVIPMRSVPIPKESGSHVIHK